MWVMWTLVVAAPEGTPDNNRKQQPTKRGSRRRSWPWFTISQMTMLRLYLGGCGLQTRRGCYAKATEHAPVLRVRLDKCGAPADWQIQFVQLYCRRSLSQECRCRAGEERLCMAQQWGNTYCISHYSRWGEVGVKSQLDSRCLKVNILWHTVMFLAMTLGLVSVVLLRYFVCCSVIAGALPGFDSSKHTGMCMELD